IGLLGKDLQQVQQLQLLVGCSGHDTRSFARRGRFLFAVIVAQLLYQKKVIRKKSAANRRISPPVLLL
ncbi:MAG: hypothetical protein IJP01_02845, partial [Oscillospiraceae bacterium]|nr:hypothetical protein [Oscillospiraceae bacterium]